MPTHRCCASACARPPARASRRPNASCCARSTSSSSDAGPDNVAITSDFMGVHAFQLPGGPDPPVHQRTAGGHHPGGAEARRAARRGSARAPAAEPAARTARSAQISFEAGDIVTQVMSFGSPTPIEVAVQGVSLADDYAYAQKVRAAAGEAGLPARPAVRAGAELSHAGYQHRPRARRPVRADHGGRGALGGAGHFVFALHRAELLARSEFRQRVPDPGGDAAEPHAERGGRWAACR